MNELKTRFIDDTYVEYYKTGKHDLAQIYLKSEADKVIRHNKYKRCLAMAWWCHNQKEIYERDSYDWELENDAVASLRNKANIMRKWHKRWLELADEFKETK